MDIIDELIQELGSDDEFIRMRAGERLISLGEAAVKPLVKALEEYNHPARHLVAAILGCIGDKSATPALIKALRDKELLVRIHAAVALGKLKDSRALEPLMHALFDPASHTNIRSLTGEPLTVRAAAAQSLGELKDSRAVPALIAALTDPSKDVRRAVIHALMQIGDQRAIEPLINAFASEEDKSVRALMGRAIAQIGGESAIHALRTRIANDERLLNELNEALRDIVGSGATTAQPVLEQQKIEPTKQLPRWKGGAAVSAISASLAVGALLCGACAIYFVAEAPVRALLMLGIGAVLTIIAGSIIALWHRRERLRQLEFTLRRGKPKNRCKNKCA